jgi:hypothetical protein
VPPPGVPHGLTPDPQTLPLGVKSFLDTFFQKSICLPFFCLLHVSW